MTTKPKAKAKPVDRGPGPDAAEIIISVHDDPVDDEPTADDTSADGEED